MAGDPPCWSHIFYENENATESEPMTKSTKTVKSSGAKTSGSKATGAKGSRSKSAGNGVGGIPRDIEKFLSDNDARILNELFDLLRIPSVSAKSDHNGDTKRAAEWVKASLDKIGVPAKIYPTAGHPVVVGEWRKAQGAPTVLISDSAMFAPGLPSILSLLRGLAYFEINVQGPAGDLHSGSYGGAIVNPAMALARILATFHDENGRIAIPGFYDKVREWDPKIRKQMRSLPFDDKTLMKEAGVDA